MIGFCCSSAVALLMPTTEFHAAATSNVADRQPAITVQMDHDVFPVGAPIPLCIDFQNRVLQMGRGEIPWGMEIFLTYPDGKVREAYIDKLLDKQLPKAAGVGLPPLPSEAFTLPPKTSVRLQYDLRRLFELKNPGEYTLRLTFFQVELARIDIRLVNLDYTERIELQSVVSQPYIESDYFATGINLVSELHLAVSSGSKPGEEKFTYLVARTLKMEDQPRTDPTIYFRAPPATQVKEYAVDYRWNLWTVVEHDGKSALLIWNLRAGKVRTALPWQSEKIEFGTARATRDVLKAVIVVAGRTGKPLLTTLSATEHFQVESFPADK